MTRKYWDEDLKHRKIMSGYIRDGVLGKKRLISMTDRVTNTISTLDQGVVYRPTVINCYADNLGKDWFKAWLKFMFNHKISVQRGDDIVSINVVEMLSPIKKSKYPAITAEEESISLPLQTVFCALFDATLIHMMNTVSTNNWEPLRMDICNKLNRHKVDRTIEILERTYGDQDVQFLQEVAATFKEACTQKPISQIYDIYRPEEMDSDRDQNSFILLRKGRFRDVKEVTADVLLRLGLGDKGGAAATAAPIAKGDLLALTVVDTNDYTKYLLGSFHGDTNGLATIPVVKVCISECMFIWLHVV